MLAEVTTMVNRPGQAARARCLAWLDPLMRRYARYRHEGMFVRPVHTELSSRADRSGADPADREVWLGTRSASLRRTATRQTCTGWRVFCAPERAKSRGRQEGNPGVDSRSSRGDWRSASPSRRRWEPSVCSASGARWPMAAWSGSSPGWERRPPTRFYGAVAALGLTAISSAIVAHQSAVRLVGGVFLCYLGVRTALSHPALDANPVRRAGWRRRSARRWR